MRLWVKWGTRTETEKNPDSLVSMRLSLARVRRDQKRWHHGANDRQSRYFTAGYTRCSISSCSRSRLSLNDPVTFGRTTENTQRLREWHGAFLQNVYPCWFCLTHSLNIIRKFPLRSGRQTSTRVTDPQRAKLDRKHTHNRAGSASYIPKIAVQTRNLHWVYKVSGELCAWAL